MLPSYFFFCSYYAVLALSCGMLVRVGVLSLAHGGLASIGAFSSVACWMALSSTHSIGWFGLILGFGAATLAGGALATLLGLVVVRVEGDAVLVVTMLFVDIVRRLIEMTGRFGGASGISLSPLPMLSPDVRLWLLAGFSIFCALLTSLTIVIFRKSGLGAILDTIRHDPQGAASLGFNVRKIRYWLFVWSGLVAGAAGALFALFNRFVSPSTFGVNFAILVFVMALVGRKSSPFGGIFGACALYMTPELLRLPSWRIPVGVGGLDSISASEVWPLAFGLVVVGLARVRSEQEITT